LLQKKILASLNKVGISPFRQGRLVIREADLKFQEPRRYKASPEKLREITGDTSGMNFIFITVDALRPDHLGCYGYHRETSPHIDRFAKEGVLFEWAFIQAADSPNSLSRYFTSHYLVSPFAKKSPETITEIMDKNGYETAAVYDGAVWNRYKNGFIRGFDRYITSSFPYDKIFSMSTGPELNRLATNFFRENKNNKFFMWLHYLEPHLGYMRHPEIKDFGSGGMNAYDSEIAAVDMRLGELFDELRALGIYDKTIIVLSADHGETFKEHGETAHGRQLYNESIRVPLIMKLPGVSGKRFAEKVEMIDVVPTIVEVLNLKTDAKFDGVSLVPLIYFGDAQYLTPVHTWVTWGPLDAEMIIDGDWKLIYTTRTNSFELYNLKDDPGEKINVFDSHTDIDRKLGEELFSWIKFKLHKKIPEKIVETGRKKAAAVGGSKKEKPTAKPAPETVMREPRDIAVGPEGNLYVADFGNKCVRKLSPDGKLLETWGKKGSKPGEFKDPSGIAMDRDGNVYVADTWNQRIQKFTGAGKFLKEIRAGLSIPTSILVSGDGNIIVANTGRSNVKIVSPEGKVIRTIGKEGTEEGEFMKPYGLALDGAGHLYVADRGNKRIQEFDLDGKHVRTIKVSGWKVHVFNWPYLACDTEGNLYATDPPDNRVLKFSPAGSLIGELRPKEGGKDMLRFPMGLAVDTKKNVLYVVDTWNHRVRRFPLTDFK
jgi:arylsulfatase A-like enzyme/sugar lactone lactonase YvrE